MSSRQRRPTPGSTRTAQGACQCFPTPLSSEPALLLKGGFRILILSQPQLHTCVLPFVTHKPFSQVPSEVLVHLLLLPVHRDLVLAKLSRGVYCSIYCRQHGKGDGKRTQTLGLPEPCSAGGVFVFTHGGKRCCASSPVGAQPLHCAARYANNGILRVFK